MRLGATAHDVASPEGLEAIEGRVSQAEEIREARRQASPFSGQSVTSGCDDSGLSSVPAGHGASDALPFGDANASIGSMSS
jgi:hypothetical protein